MLTTTSLLGITILPVPLARRSKLLLTSVVVIKLPSIKTSSNCAFAPIVNDPVTWTEPVIAAPLLIVVLPACTIAPVIFADCKSVSPTIVAAFVISTLLVGK